MPWIHVTVFCLSSANHIWIRVHEPYSDSFVICFNSTTVYPQDVRETFSACCDLSLSEKLKQITAVVGSLSVLFCSTT